MRFAAKLGLSAAVAALAIGPLLGTAVFFEAREVLQERIVQEHFQMARGVLREIDTAMQGAYTDVSVIAADELLRGFMEAPSDGERKSMVAEELEERERLTGPWRALAVFDVSGNAVFAPKPLGGEKAIEAYPASLAAFQRAVKGEVCYSDRVIRRTGSPVVIFAAPVRGRADGEGVVGVVVAHYDWASVRDILDHVAPSAVVHLVDRQGAVIGKRTSDPLDGELLPPVPRIAAGDAKSGYAITPRSVHGEGSALTVELEQSGLQDYRGSGWRLVLEQPLDRAFAPITRMARDTALWVIVALLVLAGLFGVLGRRFLSPLASLVQGVRQVAGGELAEKVAVRSKDEFGELAGDFNAMVDKLQERTRQLAAAQEELVKKEKMAMLGQVAASVGHELRNPLGVMNNAVYYLQTVLPDVDEDTREYLEIIKDEIAKSEGIVADLLDAVRTIPPRAESVEVGEMVAGALEKCVIPSSVMVRLDLPEPLPPLWVDSPQMQQVLRNLVANAVDAMPRGGVLEIRARSTEDGKTLDVGVQDSGTGMTPEQMARLFQPLFTTKARGIGLGLVVVKNLAQANGGSVAVRSEPGKGTTFTLTLPTAGGAEPSP
jgi:signal transduction histidine kinase